MTPGKIYIMTVSMEKIKSMFISKESVRCKLEIYEIHFGVDLSSTVLLKERSEKRL